MTKDRSGPVWSIGVIMNTWYTEKGAKREKEGGRWGGESEAGRQIDRQMGWKRKIKLLVQTSTDLMTFLDNWKVDHF